MVSGRTKGLTFRGKGNVVLVAAQLEDGNGNPTEEYVFLRADLFGRLRTVGGAGGGGSTLFPNIDDVGETTWGVPGWMFDDVGDSSLVANRLYYLPIYVERSRIFTQIGMAFTVSGGAGTDARLGIYEADFDASGDLTPGALILDAGTVETTAPGEKSIAISETLAEGFYFLVIGSDGTADTNRPGNTEAYSGPFTGRNSIQSGGMSAITSVDVVDGTAALTDPATAPTTREDPDHIFVQLGE